MGYKYSHIADAFYPVDMLGTYADLPTDLMDVSAQTYDAVLQARNQGLSYRITDDGASVSVAPSAAHDWDMKTRTWVLNEEKRAEFKAQAQAQAITQAVDAVKHALQARIDQVAQSLGFSGGNAVMLYAGFDNQFKPLAQAFGAWEAGIWVAANQYMVQVKSGDAPMLTPEQAVERMPAFEFAGA